MSRNYRPGQLEQIMANARERGMIGATTNAPAAPQVAPELPKPPARPAHVWGKMNVTESEFSRILDRRKAAGEIKEWAFEPFAIRIADDTSYCPDFVSIAPSSNMDMEDLRALFTRPAFELITNARLSCFALMLREQRTPLAFLDEIKGGHVWEKGRIKFKAAAERIAPWIVSNLWQKKKGEWAKLL